MKKTLIILAAFLSFAFKNAPKIAVATTVCATTKMYAQFNAVTLPDSSYNIRQAITNWPAITVRPNFLALRNNRILVDSVVRMVKIIDGSYYMITVNPITKELSATTFSNVSFPSNTYSAGYGLTKTGSEPNANFKVDTVTMMYTSKANAAIADINTNVNGKVPASRIITINGVGQDLSADRGWSVTASVPTQTLTGSNGISITSATNSFTISQAARTMTATSRSVVTSTAATGFSISATSDYNVNYSVYAQVTSILAGTNTADVFLEISPNNSAPWTTISRSGISVGGVISTTGNTQTIGGFIPKTYFVRIRTAATGINSGSAVFTYQNGQENSY